MTLKKMLLLAGMALAAVAYMAPAAQADEWFTHEKNKEVTLGGAAKPDKVTFTGELTSTSASGLTSGPCPVSANAEVWNEVFTGGVVTGTGKVTAVTITATPAAECKTNLPGCFVSKATVEKLPWHVDVLASTVIDITGANFKNTYTDGTGNPGCAAFAVPHEVEATGTLTGQGVNRALPARFCIVFNNSGDMTVDPTTEVTIDGEVCAPNLTLK